MNILEVSHVYKRYKTVRALKDVSFSVPEGSIYGILGPNGSGKTTLLGIVTGVLRADSGEYELLEDKATPKHLLRRQFGTLLETPNFYHYLSALDNLKIAAGIKGTGTGDIPEILQKVGLYERQNSRFSTFSLGMKQRLAIGAALLGNPRALILDEPMNGLDPEGIVEIRELIRSLGRSGHTIIMASHLLDEVEKVCSHVAVLKKGVLLAEGTGDEIFAEGDMIEASAGDTDALVALLERAYPKESVVRDGDTVTVAFRGRGADTGELNRLCFTEGVVLSRLVLKRKSLESNFIELVSKPEKRA